ncbi:TIGR03862 family flavoprotein [Emcibacter sp. SYSU 3D8]|uniref:TIGR03862 family flavoprotein n=1 Tax=Emcibacter sp. SYSU 3D8 TaxID=3133969 RepID=UPI0031FE858D
MNDGRQHHVAVIGAGPAGLMAADILSDAGMAVTIYDRMPSPGRKLLMAGRGGLNLTHSEPFDTFATRYGAASGRLRPILEALPPPALVAWAEGLGETTFTGSSGRVFPTAMKASPLLRALLRRLGEQGVTLRTRHDWLGWDPSGALLFQTGQAKVAVTPDATVLALGGASWPKLGSDGGWASMLAARNVALTPFAPSNCGYDVDWSEPFRTRFAGAPLKGIAITYGDHTVRGEAIITAYGIEGGAVYALGPGPRDALSAGRDVMLQIDLRPDMTADRLRDRLARPAGSQSLSNFLRKAVKLSPLAINLMREAGPLPTGPASLAALIKAVPVTLSGTQPIDRAISTAGGIRLDALDDTMMLRALPGVFAAGEMLDWEAPTGGYLLQACFATGAAAAKGVQAWIAGQS